MKPETEASIREFIATAEGWCTVEKALEMAQLILDTKAKSCIELGVFSGGSLIPQALALKEQGFGWIVGIDPWRKELALEGENEANRLWWESVDLEKMHRLTMEAIWRYGLESQAFIVRASSQDFAKLGPPVPLDCLNVDANHSEEASTRDVSQWLKFVKPEAYVWMDDCQWPSTQKAVAMLDVECNLIRDHESYRLYQKR